jgi:L-ribulokinase
VRGICAAGHKCLFGIEWGGFPATAFFDALNPKLTALRNRLFTEAFPSDHVAGRLTQEFADAVGLPAGIPVTCGAFDCHHGAVGAGIKEGTLVNTMGTSACVIMAAPMDKALADIPGLCGIVPGSVVPGMYGLESGQSAVGDLFAWFVHHLVPADYGSDDVHARLSEEAGRLKAGQSGLLALDWNNGNRTVLVDQALTGLLVGQTLHTNAAEIFRALIEATAFGARMIIERHEEYGVQVKEIIACGGIAEKNPLVMQIYADICNRPIKISRSAQTCALGAAVFGAVVGGGYENVAAAQACMCGVKERIFTPEAESVAIYQRLFTLYRQLHDAFAATDDRPDLSRVMKELIAIRRQTRGGGEEE